MEYTCSHCGRISDELEMCCGSRMTEKKQPAPRKEFMCLTCGRTSEVEMSCCGRMMDKK